MFVAVEWQVIRPEGVDDYQDDVWRGFFTTGENRHCSYNYQYQPNLQSLTWRRGREFPDHLRSVYWTNTLRESSVVPFTRR